MKLQIVQLFTCPGEGGDGSEAQGSVEASRQSGRRRPALARTLMAGDELGEVGGWGGDKGVCHVRGEKRRVAAERWDHRAACKISATQEQRNSLLPAVKS